MFEDFRRERQVRRALKAIARQRVAMILKPNNVQVIERCVPKDEWFEVGVATAQIRGWVEVLYDNLPTGALSLNGNNVKLPNEMTSETHYKLTEGGWAVLNRSHAWVLATFIVSAVGLVVAVMSLVISLKTLPTPYL